MCKNNSNKYQKNWYQHAQPTYNRVITWNEQHLRCPEYRSKQYKKIKGAYQRFFLVSQHYYKFVTKLSPLKVNQKIEENSSICHFKRIYRHHRLRPHLNAFSHPYRPSLFPLWKSPCRADQTPQRLQKKEHQQARSIKRDISFE